MKWTAAALFGLILVAGCGETDPAEGLTRAEERELDAAAARLDQSPVGYEAAIEQPVAQQTPEDTRAEH